MTYNVIKNYCRCHPETCGCNPWAVVDGTTTITTCYDKDTAEAVATKLNKFQVQHYDDFAVLEFSEAMKQKLAQCRNRGRSGWETASVPALWAALTDELQRTKRDPIDIANYAMMIWHLTHKE